MTTSHRKQSQRYNEAGHAHFLTFSCYRRLPLLSRDRTRHWLAAAINRARQRLEFDLWGYVFMPEHVHLLLWPRQPAYDISTILWRIKKPVGTKAIAFSDQTAPDWLRAHLTVVHRDGRMEHRFWQAGGGYDRNLVEPADVLAKTDYVHANPVRRGLAERPEDWEWSSARWYAGCREGPLTIDPLPFAVPEE